MNLSLADEIEDLSLEKHGAFLVNFRTKMKGRSCLECVEEGSDWTKYQLRGEIRDPSRTDRGRAVRRALRDQRSQASQGKPREPSCSNSSRPRRRSRDPLGDVRGAHASRSSGNSVQSHDADGAGNAGNDHSHPSAQCTPELLVSEVFVGKGCKQLQYPLGALPATVAPWWISLCMRRPDGQAVTYQSLGQEDRTTMPTASKRARIPVAEILITIFAQSRPSGSVAEQGSRQNIHLRKVRLDRVWKDGRRHPFPFMDQRFVV
eukprot:s5678_g1.t1